MSNDPIPVPSSSFGNLRKQSGPLMAALEQAQAVIENPEAYSTPVKVRAGQTDLLQQILVKLERQDVTLDNLKEVQSEFKEEVQTNLTAVKVQTTLTNGRVNKHDRLIWIGYGVAVTLVVVYATQLAFLRDLTPSRLKELMHEVVREDINDPAHVRLVNPPQPTPPSTP